MKVAAWSSGIWYSIFGILCILRAIYSYSGFERWLGFGAGAVLILIALPNFYIIYRARKKVLLEEKA